MTLAVKGTLNTNTHLYILITLNPMMFLLLLSCDLTTCHVTINLTILLVTEVKSLDFMTSFKADLE